MGIKHRHTEKGVVLYSYIEFHYSYRMKKHVFSIPTCVAIYPH